MTVCKIWQQRAPFHTQRRRFGLLPHPTRSPSHPCLHLTLLELLCLALPPPPWIPWMPAASPFVTAVDHPRKHGRDPFSLFSSLLPMLIGPADIASTSVWPCHINRPCARLVTATSLYSLPSMWACTFSPFCLGGNQAPHSRSVDPIEVCHVSRMSLPHRPTSRHLVTSCRVSCHVDLPVAALAPPVHRSDVESVSLPRHHFVLRGILLAQTLNHTVWTWFT